MHERTLNYSALAWKLVHRTLVPTSVSLYDLYQEAFIAVIKAFDQHDPNGDAKEITFVYRGIQQYLWNVAGKETRYASRFKQVDTPIQSYTIDYDTPILMEELLSLITKRQAEVVRLRLENYTFREIGEILHMTKQCARQLYAKAIERMKENVGTASTK